MAQKEDFIYLALPFLIGDRTLQFHTLRIIGNLCYENGQPFLLVLCKVDYAFFLDIATTAPVSEMTS